MKKNCVNYLLVMFSFLGLGMFSSCTPGEEVATPLPTITFIPGATSAEVEAGTDYDLSVTYKAEQKIDKITVYKTVGATENTFIAAKTSGFNSSTEHTEIYKLTAETTGDAKYRFNVVDKDGKESSLTLTVTTKGGQSGSDLSAATAFEWKRVGTNTGTGLEAFGLSWTSNTTTSAVIKKGADKLVILSASDWTSIMTKEALKAKVDAGTDAPSYTGVSSTANKTYNDVIATKKGENYYLINITKSTVASSTAGTTITITGNSKN